MGSGYEKRGLLTDGSCDEKAEERRIFILHKRVYYVFQVAFVASIYKRRYTRGLGTKGRGLHQGGVATPAEMSCFCKRATTKGYRAQIKPVSHAFNKGLLSCRSSKEMGTGN
jgi:hypothetical protein